MIGFSAVALWFCAGVALLAMSTAAVADGAPVQLRLGGKPNDTYQRDSFVEIATDFKRENGAGDMLVETAVATRQRISVVGVSPSGNITFVLQPVRLLKSVKMNGRTTVAFDTGNAAQRERARENPETKAMVAALDAALETRIRVEQDPTGRTVDVAVESRNTSFAQSVERFGEEMIALDVFIFPREPIDIGTVWDAGERDFTFPGVGVLKYRLSARLERVERINGERIAQIVLKADRMRYQAAADRDPEAVKFETFNIEGKMSFSLDRGVILAEESQGTMSVRIREPDGRKSRGQVHYRMQVQQVR